jgi:prepilin-type N-terminal cleavage/methylation domain-containing protein
MKKLNKNAFSMVELLSALIIISMLMILANNVFFPASEETEIIKMQSDLRQVKNVAAAAALIKNQ